IGAKLAYMCEATKGMPTLHTFWNQKETTKEAKLYDNEEVKIDEVKKVDKDSEQEEVD
ncbi:22680_t:CDS:1, partial [Gigaspora rosea]